jgi:hypothetical protein
MSRTLQDFLDQNAKIDAFDPNKQTVSYAVWFPHQKDMALYNSTGPANNAITSMYPQVLGVLYENRNGTYIEKARAPIPDCSFCHEIIQNSFNLQNYILIKKTPMYKSALVCQDCKNRGLHKDLGLVDQVKYEKGL